MYIIENKLDVNMTATGEELKQQLEKFGMSYSLELTGDDGSFQADEPELMTRLERACTFSWFGLLPKSDQPFSDTEKNIIKKRLKVDDIYRVYAAKKLGFYNLKPGDKAEIEKKPDFLEQLVRTGRIAKNIRVTDKETGEILWDGGEEEITSVIYLSRKDSLEKKNPITIKGTKIVNLADKKEEVSATKEDKKATKTSILDELAAI